MAKWKLKQELGDGVSFELIDENGKVIDTKTIILGAGDGFKFNNWAGMTRGEKGQFIRGLEVTLNNGKIKDKNDFIRLTGKDISDKQWKNIEQDIDLGVSKMGIDMDTYDPELGRSKTEEELSSEETILNPYAAYMENKRVEQEGNERGLLDAQTNASRQNADILAQQTMQQQSMFRDQLVEQIKSDRMSKMRSGISPMQIAQENLQFMVGNMQTNNQQVGLANQGQLAAAQQKAINPYQAYINSQAATTGGQGYGAVASGLAATDAGDLDMQTQRVLKSNPNLTYQQALALVKGT